MVRTVVALAALMLAAPAFADGYHYDPSGKPDPFRAPEPNLETPRCDVTNAFCDLDLETAKLTGVVTGRANPLAMVETSDGQGIILKRGALIGKRNARVEEIRSDRVVLVELQHRPDGAPVRVTRELKLH